MPRIRLGCAFCGAAMFVCLVACSPKSSRPSDVLAEPSGPYEGSVEFDLKPVDNKSAQQWAATYSLEGKIAKFRIELGPGHAGDDDDKAFHVSLGKGRLLPEPGSDASVFLVD